MSPLLTVSLAFIAFALLHSLTASDAFRRPLTRIFGQGPVEKYYRLTYNIFSAVITAAAGYIIFSRPDRLLYRPPWLVLWLAHAVQFAGILLLAAAFRPLDFTSFIGTRPEAENQGLTTSGAYGLVRHPMYLAGILMLAFEPNITMDCMAVRTLGSAYFVYGALMEERRLIKVYGEGYAHYKKEVPMFNIIYGVVRWKKRRR